jgi:asparagine synthase (glutamine-hydrolysing)
LFQNSSKAFSSIEVLWRQKEQFSDGVGYSWIDQLKLEAERTVTDLQMKFAASRFPQSTPLTKVIFKKIM